MSTHSKRIRTFNLRGLAGAALIGASRDYLQNEGYEFLRSRLDRFLIESQFETALQGLPSNEGMLFIFPVFIAPDGRKLVEGPLLLGTATRPEQVLIDINWSDPAAAKISAAMADSLKPPPGYQYGGWRYHWAVHLRSDEIDISALDPNVLTATAATDLIASRARIGRTATGSGVQKLAEQARQFDEIEDRLREELRAAKIETELLAARGRMREAVRLYRSATARRREALAQAKKAAVLQEAMDLLGLVGSFASLAANATADADYQGTAMNRAAADYNMHVEIYIGILRDRTGLSSGQLPNDPMLELVPPG